jgi:hypothetical protein
MLQEREKMGRQRVLERADIHRINHPKKYEIVAALLSSLSPW